MRVSSFPSISTPIMALTFATMALPALAVERAVVVATYADIAEAAYGDSLATARDLDAAVDAFLATPSEAALQAARSTWLAARPPYQQTEAFRFGNPIVDDWEGRVNAWPLDEGLIDYVEGGATDENPLAVLNVVANPKLTVGGSEVDASEITPALLEEVNEADGIESNVARGYHAIEFLLWGQDLNGFGEGAGDRPWTDYAQGADCTGGNCDRRGAYLAAATDLLVSDLEEMEANWVEGGPAREAVISDPDAGIRAMLTGMGSLSYGELAGERMRLGLMLNDPEEEHDCFSDNTPVSHLNDGIGIRNVYLGTYARVDGTTVEGPSLASLVAAADPALDAEIRGKLEASVGALQAIEDARASGLAYDSMLEAGNAEGDRLIMAAVNALIDQTRSFERAVTALSLEAVAFEGSDSLDAPEAVFQ